MNSHDLQYAPHNGLDNGVGHFRRVLFSSCLMPFLGFQPGADFVTQRVFQGCMEGFFCVLDRPFVVLDRLGHAGSWDPWRAFHSKPNLILEQSTSPRPPRQMPPSIHWKQSCSHGEGFNPDRRLSAPGFDRSARFTPLIRWATH